MSTHPHSPALGVDCGHDGFQYLSAINGSVFDARTLKRHAPKSKTHAIGLVNCWVLAGIMLKDFLDGGLSIGRL